MENRNKRVLAYNLAKEISNEDLVQVTGGASAMWKMSQSPSGNVSATNGMWDTSIDVTVDW